MSNTFPPSGQPEYLEQGGGTPLRPEPRERTSLRKPLIVGGAVLGLAALGGGVWAAMSFFATGAQPAEVLPASTIGYASVDLDPSGGQKVEAIEMMRKFPAFRQEIGLDTDDDIKKKIFSEADLGDACDGLSYADDIEPWLGDRAAIAAVDTGEKMPVPIGVIQVKDSDAARDGLAKLRECGGGDAQGGWTITGEWAVIAESQSIAKEIADDAAQGSLADDATYQRWTDEVGEAGVFNVYAAPEAGKFLATSLENFSFPFGPMIGSGSAYGSESEVQFDSQGQPIEPGEMPEEFGTEGDFYAYEEETAEPVVPQEMLDALNEFKGMAATLRFSDGALELEVVGDARVVEQDFYTDAGDDALSTLPEDTVAAFGVGFEAGWFARWFEQMGGFGSGESVDEMIAAAERETGMNLPEDAETLFGDSAVLSLGSDFDPEAFFSSEDGSDVPIGVKVKGDPAAIETVLDKVRAKIGPDEGGAVFGSSSDGDMAAIGPNANYRERILADGGLGDTDAFQNVVREAEKAGAIVFVNFDAGGDWVSNLADGDEEAAENLKPLEGFGISVWEDGDTAHG
ncbi:MAG: DUF3352 domain-containing protein, partial [Nocardioides sp.]